MSAVDVLYEHEKKEERHEAREDHVAEQVEEFITQLCANFDWEPPLDFNREDVRAMIRKAIK
jgi:hypothetical protein